MSRHDYTATQERHEARTYGNHHKGAGKRSQARRNRRRAKLAIKKGDL